MASPFIHAVSEPGDIFVDPLVGGITREEIRATQRSVDSHLDALRELERHPINDISHADFMLLVNSVQETYDPASAQDCDDPNDPIMQARSRAIAALRVMHEFLFDDRCGCTNEWDCEHPVYVTSSGKCVTCPGYATLSGTAPA